MQPHQIQELLKRYAHGACTPDEERFIHDWYQNIREAGPSNPRIDRSQVENRMWSSINPAKRSSHRSLRMFVRAAAIAIPIAAVAVFYISRQSLGVAQTAVSEVAPGTSGDILHVNDGTGAKVIALADGSSVDLQPGSELLVVADFNAQERQVKLKGEGFFRVKPDAARPFVVHSNEVVTRVLGTSFNVKAYDDDSKVTVAVRTGKVSVYARKIETADKIIVSREMILTPNQEMVYHRDRKEVAKRIVEQPRVILPDSKDFRMQFDNAEVTGIFKELENKYGIEIAYDPQDLKNCRLTTSMSDEGLYERIEVICKAIGASYSIDEAVITIKTKGC